MSKATMQIGADTGDVKAKLDEVKQALVTFSGRMKEIGNISIPTDRLTALQNEMKKLQAEASNLRQKLLQSVPGTDQAREYAKALRQVETQMTRLAQETDHAKASTAGLSDRMASVSEVGHKVAFAFLAVAGAFAGVGVASIKVASDMQQNKIAFETMLGSAEAADAFLKEMKQFAATTPFELPGLLQSAKLLMAFGYSAQEVKPMLTSIGDAAAGLSLGTEGMQRLIFAMGQMKQNGRVNANDMNQITATGIAGWDILAKKIGVTVAEVRKLSEAGKISSDVAIPALLEGMSQKFGGLMDKQADSLAGKWSTFKDTLRDLAETIGNTLLPAVTRLLEHIQGLADRFNKLSPTTKTIITYGAIFATILLGVSAAVIKVLTVIGPMSAGIQALTAAISAGAIPSMAGITAALAGALPVIAVVTLGVLALAAAWKTGAEAVKAYHAIQDARRMAEQDRKGDKIAADYIKNGDHSIRKAEEARQARNKALGYGFGYKAEPSPAATPTYQPGAPEAPDNTEADRKATEAKRKADEARQKAERDMEAAHARMVDIKRRHANDIQKLQIDWQEERRKAGPVEREAIDKDYADRINQVLRDQAEKQKALAIEVLEAERKAQLSSYATRLEMAGRFFDAKKVKAYTSYISEIEDLKKLEATGVSVRQRMIDAETRYAEAKKAIDDEILQNQLSRKKDAESALDSMIEQQTEKEKERYGFLQDIGFRLLELTKGRTAAEMARIDASRDAEKAKAQELLAGSPELPDVLGAIDLEAQTKKDRLAYDDEQRANAGLADMNRKRREKVGWVGLESVGENLSIAAMRRGLPQSIEDAGFKVQKDQLRMLERIDKNLTALLTEGNREFVNFAQNFRLR